MATGYAAGAARHPDRLAIVDERGALTYGEVHERSDLLGRAMAGRGVGAGDRVAVLCRNHRGPVLAAAATAKLGADVVLLNTSLSTAQLDAVLEEQRVALVVADEEFDILGSRSRVTDVEKLATQALAGALNGSAAQAPRLPLRPPEGKLIVLTSGTTGTPRAPGGRRPGASRRPGRSCPGYRYEPVSR